MLPFDMRPDSLGESGMRPRDPYRPWRGTLGPGHMRHQCGVSHEVRRGAQGASRVAPGKSGLHVRGEGERNIALELW